MGGDTVAMQDQPFATEGSAKPAAPHVQSAPPLAAGAHSELGHALAALSPTPSPSTPPKQGDASSVASDGSELQHAPPRRHHSAVDIDAAKQAAMSALAGLDMTTTKANLDASKAAAATARANGEIPVHPRKSNLRSVSCRQLGSSASGSASGSSAAAPGAGASGTPTGTGTGAGAGKSVAFDESGQGLPKPRAAGDPGRSVSFRTATGAEAPRRPMRSPASRCISLPQVLQGRAGMASRLAATYAQDAALQQQLQLLNGAAGGAGGYAGFGQLQGGGVAQVDALSLYQLQSQVGGPGGAALLAQQRGFAGGGMALDDSVLAMRGSAGLLVPAAQQLQQQQAQLAAAGGGWSGGAGVMQAPLPQWGAGQLPAQAVPAGAGGAQLLGTAGAGANGLWMQAPSASAGLHMPGSRPQQGVMLPQGGLAGLAHTQQQQQQQLLAGGGLQQAGLADGAALQQAAPNGAVHAAALLDRYESVSWAMLAGAQGDAAQRDQLLTELVLLLTMLHTLGAVLRGSVALGEALADFAYLASAARRHMANFARLSHAGDVALQLLALATPLACRHTGSSELLEAAFLVLDTLALASRDVAAVVNQQRMAALTSLCSQVSVEQLVQQQALGLHLTTNLAGAVSRNKAFLENLGAGDAAAAAAAAGGGAPASAAMLQQGLSAASMLPGMSQPMLLAPGGAPGPSTLSPTRTKTPLQTFFEESSGLAGLAPAAGGPPGLAAPAGAGNAPPSLGGSGVPGLSQLGAPEGAPGGGASAAAFGLAGLDAELDGLALAGLGGGGSGLAVAASASAGNSGTALGSGGAGGGYSPLGGGGGLSLFGVDVAGGLMLVTPSSNAGV